EPDRPLVFVLGAGQSRREVVRQALKVGYDNLAGELAGGARAWEAAGLPVRRLRLVDIASVSGPVLDVRQDAEFAAGHLPGALHVELGSVAAASLGPGPLTVMCGHGERAMSAASLLAARDGAADVAVAVGGPGDWSDGTGGSLATGV
ncbi:MAG TPA: rhodanese-like domain-containing protein, partial [Acidimicrobiales bacterium]|nr:rhodanese-like domain-containing protein [Acidimicrobiales bacterium]